jgi:hypothetical protein
MSALIFLKHSKDAAFALMNSLFNLYYTSVETFTSFHLLLLNLNSSAFLCVRGINPVFYDLFLSPSSSIMFSIAPTQLIEQLVNNELESERGISPK